MHHDPTIDWLIKPPAAPWVRGPAGMRRAVPLFGVLVGLACAGCWTSAPQSVKTETVKPSEPTAAVEELRATVRIDAAPSGKKFQGVWLEFDGQEGKDRRWVIDYRPTEIWAGFADEAVIVTGRRYQPYGQAINAPHFEVATMRFAGRPSRAVPYRSLGPEQLLRGELIEEVWPAGTKLAGDVEKQFRTDDGAIFGLANGVTESGKVAVTAREVEVDLSYAATTGGPKLFVLRVHAHDYTPAPRGMR